MVHRGNKRLKQFALVSISIVVSLTIVVVIFGATPQVLSTLCLFKANQEQANGNKTAALADYLSAVRIWGGNREAVTQAASLLQEDGQFEDAAALYSPLYKTPSTRVFALTNLCWLELGHKNYSQALRLAKEWVSLDAKNSRAYRAQGSALQGLGRTDEAIADFDRSIALDPTSPAALDKDILLSKSRSLDLAVDGTLTPKLENKETDFDANLRDGLRLYFSADFAEAVKKESAAIKLKPSSPVGYFLRAEIYARSRHLTEAVRDYRMAEHLAGDKTFSVPSAQEVTRSVSQLGIKNWPNGKPDTILRKEADVHISLGEYEAALACCNKAIRLNKTNGQNYADRAGVYARLGKFDQVHKDQAQAQRLWRLAARPTAPSSAPQEILESLIQK